MSDTEEDYQSEDEEYEYEEDGGDENVEEYEYEGDDGKRPATPQDDGPSGSVGSGGKASLSAIPDGQALMRSVSGAPVLARMVSYQVKEETEVMEHRRQLIAGVTEWGLTESQAIDLLITNEWQRPVSLDGFGEGPSSTKAGSGIPAPVVEDGICSICSGPCESDADSYELACKHPFCHECWEQYLNISVKEKGPQVLRLSCPAYKCEEIVPAEIFVKYCDQSSRKVYESHMVAAFVDKNPTYAWCPKPTCGKAVHYAKGTQGAARDVQCVCGQYFCFSCKEEAHSPCSCSKVEQWQKKAVDEGETDKYMKSHTKACPKCKTPIGIHVCGSDCETPCKLKGRPALGGCNHFTCSCKFEFCWMCMRDWKTHGSETGGYYQCNIYVAGDAVDVKGVQAGERERLRQAEEMRRYTFYFERYRQHKEGVKSAPHLMEAAQNNIRILVEGVSAYRTQHSMSNLDPTYFQFILDMVDLVERCRRVLAWTYVFAYFLPPNSPQMNILQSQQGMMESMTDTLHEQLGTLDGPGLLAKLESGEDDLVFDWKFKQHATTHEAALESFVKRIGSQIRSWEESGILNAAAEDEASAAGAAAEEEGWWCMKCTYQNTHLSHQDKCEICKAPRGS
mmetsp:Transcript_27496/g.74770  ORF Transcript_27496/g.74770 Transcript_27496/m.74770 type:complete len:621 (-) Transcript_27496:822-2684(-)